MEQFFVGRQPILDREFQTVAYELLFRRPEGAGDAPVSDEEMTAHVLVGGLMDLGLHRLSGNLPVYVKASRGLLLHGMLEEFPPEILGVQLPAGMAADDEVLTVCRDMRAAGRSVMLGGLPEDAAWFGVADAVKVNMADDGAAGTAKEARARGLALVAGMVETLEQHERALALGCERFQGYFFCKPQVVEGRKLPESRLAVMQAMHRVMTAEAIADVEEVILRDVTLSYRLLKYINSAAFGMRRKIESVRQALALLGLANIQQWLSVMLLAAVGKDRPRELMRMALLRGRMLEGLAEQRAPGRKTDYFVLGMFSLLDAILGVPMEVALDKLYLPEDIHEGLLDRATPRGRELALVEALEQDDWARVDELAAPLGVAMGDLVGLHTQALLWVNDYMNEMLAD